MVAVAHGKLTQLCKHTPRKGSAIDLYTTFPWEALCEEVSKLKVQRRTSPGDVRPLRAIAGGAAKSRGEENRAVASPAFYRFSTDDRNESNSKEKSGGGAGSRIPPSDVGLDTSRSVSDGCPVADHEEVESASSVSTGVDVPSGRKVEGSRDPICERLALALARWTAGPNVSVLRRALLEVLIAIE
jgi:hypothetical protein